VHAAADAARRLVDVRDHALVLERERRRQARDASPDDRDPRGTCGARRTRERGGSRDGDGRADRTRPLDELAPGDARLLLPLAQLRRLDADPRRLVMLPREPPERPQHRCPRHRCPLPRSPLRPPDDLAPRGGGQGPGAAAVRGADRSALTQCVGGW
jgi:hypothetical protein